MLIDKKHKTFWPRFGAILLDGAALGPTVWLDQLISCSRTTSKLTVAALIKALCLKTKNSEKNIEQSYEG